jgi:hypothetical protein
LAQSTPQKDVLPVKTRRTTESHLSVNPIDEHSIPRLHPDAAVEEIAGELVAMTVEVSLTFGAGGVSQRIVSLVDGHRTLGRIAQVLAEEFDGDENTILADAIEFVAILVEKGFLVV